jgi:hypothetical protein
MKSLEPFRFKHLKNIDITEVKELVNGLTVEQWQENTSRQITFKQHVSTETYFIHDYPLEWKLNTPYDGTLLREGSKIWEQIKPIVKSLEEHHNGTMGRVMFTKLAPNGHIPAHKDGGEYLETVRRHHIPIITNKNVAFIVDKEKINMQEGEVWEINNAKEHEVLNLSEHYRVHLMIDIIPNQYIKES